MSAGELLPKRARIAWHCLRALPAIMMVIHGSARLIAGGVVPFGGFLGSLGLPAGVVVAGALTAVEIAGGLTLAAGWFVRPLCLWFVAEHAVGILTVHAPEGWFVVGLGRNGMEYSLVLLSLFVLIVVLDPVLRARAQPPSPPARSP